MPTVPRTLVAALAVSLCVAGPAYAPAYLKFDGVDGEVSKSGGRDGWIEVLSVDWGAAQADGRQMGSITTGEDPVAVGLLVPAVQKVREAATRAPTSRKTPVLVYRETADGQLVRTYWLRNVQLVPAGANQVRISYECKSWREEASGKKGSDCPAARKR